MVERGQEEEKGAGEAGEVGAGDEEGLLSLPTKPMPARERQKGEEEAAGRLARQVAERPL